MEGTSQHKDPLSSYATYLKIFQCFEGFCPELIVFSVAQFLISFLWGKNKYNDQDLVKPQVTIPAISSEETAGRRGLRGLEPEFTAYAAPGGHGHSPMAVPSLQA